MSWFQSDCVHHFSLDHSSNLDHYDATLFCYGSGVISVQVQITFTVKTAKSQIRHLNNMMQELWISLEEIVGSESSPILLERRNPGRTSGHTAVP